MKNIATVAFFIVATFLVGRAPAQDYQTQATVPFNFTVGKNALPSGTYTISSSISAPHLLTMRNRGKKVAVEVLGQPDQITQGDDNVLLFHQYGNQYFLSDVRSAGASICIHFPTTKAEKRAKAQVEEARLSVDAPALIALK